MNIPERATKEQTEAITQTEGNIRVASVPGSGKTFVLTYRIAYLITELFVEPSSIVALTFTNKAASQMKHRLRNIVGDNANCFTGTFHGYCNMFLKEEIHRLTFPKTFTILDKKAELEMIKDVAEDMGISLKDNTAKKIMSDIDITKQDMSYVELMAGVDKTELKRRASSEKNVDKKVFYNYLKRQCDNYALDFEDLINFTLYILNRNEDVRIRWQEKCQYVLCDEYQDVNMKQHIYVVQSESGLETIDKLTPCRYNAPTVLIVAFNKNNVFTYPGDKRNSGIEDATIVATHLMLAAYNEGVDSCWINFFNPDELAKAFNLPEDEEILMLLDLGVADKTTTPLPNHNSRKALTETVSFI